MSPISFMLLFGRVLMVLCYVLGVLDNFTPMLFFSWGVCSCGFFAVVIVLVILVFPLLLSYSIWRFSNILMCLSQFGCIDSWCLLVPSVVCWLILLVCFRSWLLSSLVLQSSQLPLLLIFSSKGSLHHPHYQMCFLNLRVTNMKV